MVRYDWFKGRVHRHLIPLPSRERTNPFPLEGGRLEPALSSPKGWGSKLGLESRSTDRCQQADGD